MAEKLTLRRVSGVVLAFVVVWLLAACKEATPSSRNKEGVPSFQETDLAQEGDWSMSGANPQRTSWTPEEVRGKLYPLWAVSIEPFIPMANQVIAAYDTLYLSTAKGLYALNAATGALRWVFPTAMPLGNSPTIYDGVAYVGGYDHRLYALDAISGQLLWSYEAGGGFATNPLVVEGKVILGNRDGYLYAIHTDGTLAWRFETGGPILFSAAYKDGVIYFASNDSHAYAVYTDGCLKWKSAKLPGGGFYAYWPVIYTQSGHDYVVLGGSNDYRVGGELSVGTLNNNLDRDALYYDIPQGQLLGPTGKEPGDWAPGTITIDDSRAAQYLEAKPDRRRVFILDSDNGREFTFDSDRDGSPEYAPITWYTSHGGNRYPSVVGGDGVLYQGNSYLSDPYIPRGGPAGWKFGSQYISRIHEGQYGAVDEPMAVSAGGSLIYWALGSGAESLGAYDITLPYAAANRGWIYWDTGQPDYLVDSCPGAGAMYGQGAAHYPRAFYTAGTTYGIYGPDGHQSPAIPYKGKLYFQSWNTVFALSATPSTCQSTHLPAFSADSVSLAITEESLKQKLSLEIQKIVSAGHLRPGYYHGTLQTYHFGKEYNSYMTDYFHNSADTFVTLTSALPFLSSDLQTQLRTYLQSEWATYGNKVHIGWQNGAARETYDIPPEIQARMSAFGPMNEIYGLTWDDRYNLYGRWKYIQQFDNQSHTLATQVFSQIRNSINTTRKPEQDGTWDGTTSVYHPYIKNAYIAGYLGYIGIGKLAGYSETGAELSPYVTELNRLLAERATEFSKDQPPPVTEANVVTIARNFMYLTPELADYLRDHALRKIQEALDEYYRVGPYWFVSKYDGTSGEGALQPLYDYSALFQAKALILKEPREELVRYLDVPAFERGDLFYIQNLVSAIGATPGGTATSTPVPSATPTAAQTTGPTTSPTATATRIASATPAPSTTPPAGTPPTISGVVDNRADYPGSQVPKDAKLEITFNLASVAQNPQMPYDPAPPPGVVPGIGVTVNGLFSSDNWQTTYTQPAFYYQDFDYAVREEQDWIYPSSQFAWKVRFAPNAVGTWQYKLVAQDAGGLAQTQPKTFEVVASSSRGFVRVSQTDSRYFELADGTYFPALGYNMNFDRISWNDPLTSNQSTFQTMGSNGIQLARVWLSQWSIFGSQDGAWRSPFLGSGYDGLYTAASGEVYPGSDTSLGLVWSTDTTVSPGSPCMFLGWMKKAPAVKPNTSYHISLRYRIPQAIPGPNIAGQPYGLVAKLGGWVTDAFAPAWGWRPHQECAYPAALTNQISPGLRVRPITSYVSTASTGWATLEGDFVTDADTTGAGNYLPYLYLALENVNPGPGQGNKAFIDQVEVRENLAGGQRGPSIIGQSSMSRLQYFDQRQSYAFDQVLELARQNGVYLKLAVLEKNEFTQNHFDYNGNPTTSESNDYFYGNWGKMTKVYWLQRAYWRYLQARWGYSPNVHSWELLNEGDPYSGLHYTLADNFAQYMHQFKPNDHLVTTSFWHSFPTLPFWQNVNYSHLDYADVHAYIVKNRDITLRVDKPTDGTYITIASPSDYYDTAAETQLLSMQIGARQPYGVGKPVMRGETGFVIGNSGSYDTELWRDTQGIWLHNYIWGQINPGGLIESYWYDYFHILDPEQGFDHRDLFGKYYKFIKDIPLSNGHYQDAAATASTASLRVWGQKDLVNQRAHLWIANPQHTWKNVVDNVAIPALTGAVTIGALQPNSRYQVQWWDTYAGTASTVQELNSSSAGDLTLSISGLTSDTAVKIALASPSETPVPSPTATPTNTPLPPTATNTPTNTPTHRPTNTSTPTNTPTATPTSLTDGIFSDGFESGNLAAWTSNVTNGGALSVSPSAALKGNYGLQAVTDSNTAIYLTDDSPEAEPRYRARFYFDPNSVSIAPFKAAHYIFCGYQGTSTAVLRIELRYQKRRYQLRAGLVDNAGRWSPSNLRALSDAPHFIEIDWAAATASGANNGYLTLWIDGAQTAKLTGVANDTRRIDWVQLGAIGGVDTATRGTYYFDAFESRRQTYIGP